MKDEALHEISSSYNVPKLRYRLRPQLQILKILLQNHSSVTLYIICVYKCLMNIFTTFCLPTVFLKLSYGSPTPYIKTYTASHKITES